MGIVNLIGGGESAENVEPDALEGLTIGLNDAGLHKPCRLWFSLDIPYAHANWHRVLDTYHAPMVHLCGHARQRVQLVDMSQAEGATWWRRLLQDEPTTFGERTLATGAAPDLGCTGIAALNLAYRLGASEIRLYGFDFHDDYRYFYSTESYPRLHAARVRKLFDAVAPYYAARGVRIFNANPQSSIKAFPCL